MGWRKTEERTLADELPELIPHLKTNINVLDVGCGSGTIALDVAEKVTQGCITGIDVSNDAIAHAKQHSAIRDAKNIRFLVADAHSAPFDDDTFDLAYSYTVAHFWWEPSVVLRELRRIVKPGGLIITAGVRDFGFAPKYPRCESWEEVWDGLGTMMQSRLAEYRRGNVDNRGYWDFSAGRKCIEWYSEAGISDIKTSLKVEDWWYPGSTDMHSMFINFMMFNSSRIKQLLDEGVSDGFIDASVVAKGEMEARNWMNNPHAFHFHTLLMIEGTA